jgi:flagellar hook-associated protein 3 FlgL
MKVTENTTYRMLQTNLGRISTRLEDLRFEGSSGIRLNRPSDDPASIRPVLTTRTQIRHNERYLETMGVTLDKMEATDGYLANVENVLVRAKELAINAVDGGLSNEDLSTLADEVAELRQQMLDSANAKVDGKYIFAGYEENTIPFVENALYDPLTYDPNNPTTWPYIYQGDNNPTQLEITPGEYLQANLTGNDLFFGISNANWVDSTTPALNQPEAGRVNIFNTLTRLEEAIRAGNVDDPLGAGGGIQAQIDNLEVSADQERRLRSQLGNRAARVEAAMLHQEDVQVDLKSILSRYQDTDIIENFNEIVKQETAFQAALSITSKVSDISILDYF